MPQIFFIRLEDLKYRIVYKDSWKQYSWFRSLFFFSFSFSFEGRDTYYCWIISVVLWNYSGLRNFFLAIKWFWFMLHSYSLMVRPSTSEILVWKLEVKQLWHSCPFIYLFTIITDTINSSIIFIKTSQKSCILKLIQKFQGINLKHDRCHFSCTS